MSEYTVGKKFTMTIEYGGENNLIRFSEPIELAKRIELCGDVWYLPSGFGDIETVSGDFTEAEDGTAEFNASWKPLSWTDTTPRGWWPSLLRLADRRVPGFARLARWVWA